MTYSENSQSNKILSLSKGAEKSYIEISLCVEKKINKNHQVILSFRAQLRGKI